MLSNASAMADRPPLVDVTAWAAGIATVLTAIGLAYAKYAPWARRRALDEGAAIQKERKATDARYDKLLERLETRCARLEERFEEADMERNRLLAINSTQAAEIVSLQVQVNGQRGQISYLTEENGRLCAKVDALESENTALKTKVAVLERLEKATHHEETP